MSWKYESEPWTIVRRLMREQGLSNQDLADALDVSLSSANGFMAGKRATMTTLELATLCVLFDVGAEEIEPNLTAVMDRQTKKLRDFRATVEAALRSKS